MAAWLSSQSVTTANPSSLSLLPFWEKKKQKSRRVYSGDPASCTTTRQGIKK